MTNNSRDEDDENINKGNNVLAGPTVGGT